MIRSCLRKYKMLFRRVCYFTNENLFGILDHCQYVLEPTTWSKFLNFFIHLENILLRMWSCCQSSVIGTTFVICRASVLFKHRLSVVLLLNSLAKIGQFEPDNTELITANSWCFVHTITKRFKYFVLLNFWIFDFFYFFNALNKT